MQESILVRLLISVDFEKAFDSLEICYLIKVLQILFDSLG